MLEQLNEITERKLGIQVELVAPSDYNNRVNLMLAGNEQLDIALASSNMFLENYMNSKLVAIDGLLNKYGQGIIEQLGRSAIDACRINGQLFTECRIIRTMRQGATPICCAKIYWINTGLIRMRSAV